MFLNIFFRNMLWYFFLIQYFCLMMTMFSGISNFLRRHRRKILVAGGLVTAGIFLKRYATQKFLEWEAKQTQLYLEQLKRHHHFEGTMQTCDSTALSLASKVREAVVRQLDVETLLMELKNNPPNKLSIWEEIKVLVFAHAIGEVVCECLLVVYLRVQLSILGGYMYVDSQKHKAAAAGNGLYLASTAVQQKYLSQINHFFQVGQGRVLKTVMRTVEAVLGQVSLKSLLRLKDFEQELGSIKARLFASEIFQANFLTHCFLSEEVQGGGLAEKPSQSSDFVIHKMVQETKDVLESPDFEKVVVCCMDRGMARILDMLSECYLYLHQDSNPANSFSNPNNTAVALAKLLPTLRSCILRQNPADLGSYMHQLLQLETLNNFSANIYEAFSQPQEV
ncbi:PEX3 [Cordylochernes scorpioides]|uniref:Peroxisomal biogenesis factor 3 n=1 Tax=Cordylochernes scorpioides TaxID=51811 RepID=A0ABY6K1S5_9ARAC|nr:PEX3 [Cordylochernes scorpioides]